VRNNLDATAEPQRDTILTQTKISCNAWVCKSRRVAPSANARQREWIHPKGILKAPGSLYACRQLKVYLLVFAKSGLDFRIRSRKPRELQFGPEQLRHVPDSTSPKTKRSVAVEFLKTNH